MVLCTAGRQGESAPGEGWRKRNTKEMMEIKMLGVRGQMGPICAESGWPESES